MHSKEELCRKEQPELARMIDEGKLVEVVRCKDCEHFYEYDTYLRNVHDTSCVCLNEKVDIENVDYNFGCIYGIRKESEASNDT